MMQVLMRLIGGLALLGAWLLPAQVAGFERSRDPVNSACLWWESRQVEVVLNEACSADVEFSACQTAVWDALGVWNAPSCSDFQFVDGGTTSEAAAGFDPDDEESNINLLVFVEETSDWRHEPTAIAMTTSTYDRQTGRMVDTDVEFNGVSFTFSTVDAGNVRVDIRNTLAHQAGHMLGLDHSTNPDATMWGTAPDGELSKRDLSQDDIDGLCHIYPAGEDLPPCPGGPEPPDDEGGCAAGGPPGALSGLIGMAFLAYSWRRRKDRLSR